MPISKIHLKVVWGTLVVIAAAVISGFFFYKTTQNQTPEVVYTVAKQDVRETVLATGTVTSATDLNLSFKNSGTVTQIKVAVGSNVRAGSLLAMLDQGDANVALSQARANLTSAQASYQKLINGNSPEDIAVAKAAVATAEVNLANAKSNYTNVVAQQENAVANAYSALLNSDLAAIPSSNNLGTVTLSVTGTYTGKTGGDTKITIYSSSLFGYSGLENGSGSINRGAPVSLGDGLFITFSSSGTINNGDSWTISIPNTQASNYLSNYNAYQASLQTQSKTIASAQADIDSAVAALNQAKANLALKEAAPRPEDIASAKAAVASAQAQVNAATNTYNGNIIYAPISGVITSVDTKVGEKVTANQSVIGILNKNALRVESFISESSIAAVKPGQVTDMTFDAFGPNTHFAGQVISIDPASTVISGVIDYRVVSSLPNDKNIKPGMSVNLTIVVFDKPDVMAVPNRLIKTRGGLQYVTVLKNGMPTDIEITTGVVGDNFTEVISGLNIGDEIVKG